MRLKGKVAIVTGAAQGIGAKTAKVFAEEGAKVVVADYDAEGGKETAEAIKDTGAEAMFVQVDVSSLDAARDMVDETVKEYGRLDILVNNAGVTADTLLTKMTEEQWDKVIDVNLKGVFNCAKPATEQMLDQDSGGVILNASSVVGLYGNVGQTNYAATKFGVIGLTKTWSKELGPKGIRVNAVAPGFVETPMTDAVPDKVLDKMANQTPLKRLGDPEDIAKAYLYLASDEAKYVNGEVLSVDGGLVLS
ncbi:3-oxoacyl-ACP reductase FabG [Halanaerobacter jeridensis]|uniref:3-oxoacyl-[acyl-carrier-protein] reductase n=1 Tax=Halanaerobacter jeridensis TaxID=706427 RepID=A0A939BPB5_9FIRM|nr:3-oxoacyl-ACP reductase FabG [Halanaerobacter jeridensis]MBM7556822.1 3-oxoacyl-[acyl-carrier protein] reductase [Halanaerobacter jeridensis]